MSDDEPVGQTLDEALLRTVAQRVGGFTPVETVSVFPISSPESVSAQSHTRYYPSWIDRISLECRAHVTGDFYITYREERNGQAWMCQWNRHESPHSTRDHFHRPPDAATADAADREHPTDFMPMLEQVFHYIDARVGDVWDQR